MATDLMSGLETRIQAAMADALPQAELEQIKDGQDRATRRFLEGKTTRGEYDRELAPYLDLRGAIELTTPEEFESALRLVPLPDPVVQETVEHELAHWQADRAQGLDPKFLIQFFTYPDGRIGLYPSIKSGLVSGSDEEARDQLRSSLHAPHDPSPRDQSQLE